MSAIAGTWKGRSRRAYRDRMMIAAAHAAGRAEGERPAAQGS